jgi:hypothetical protein
MFDPGPAPDFAPQTEACISTCSLMHVVHDMRELGTRLILEALICVRYVDG